MIDIPKSRAICQAATPGTDGPAGNKHWYDGGTDEIDGHRMFAIYRDGPDSVETIGYVYSHWDMQFIVAARNPETGWPAALDELERLTNPVQIVGERFQMGVCECGEDTTGPNYCGYCGRRIEWV